MKHLSAFINGLFLFAVVATAAAQIKNLLPVRIIYYVAILLWPARKEPLLEDYKTGFFGEGIGGIKSREQLYLIATLVYVNFSNEAFFNNSGNISVASIKGGVIMLRRM